MGFARISRDSELRPPYPRQSLLDVDHVGVESCEGVKRKVPGEGGFGGCRVMICRRFSLPGC